MSHRLSAGYAQHTITPSLQTPVYLAGFDPNRRAESIHDDLWVRTLALAWGETRLAFACVDALGLGRSHCLDIQARVNETCGPTAVIVACTHTHHGPDTIGLWGPSSVRSGVDPNYLHQLKRTVAGCCHDALRALRPVTLRTASASAPQVVQNFRDPAIVDAELSCLQWVDDGGQPFATLLVYPCHPEVLERENMAITSDYAHSLRRTVETASGAPALFCVGALGGMLSPNMPEQTFAAAEEMGARLGQAALAALARRPAHPVTDMALTRRVFTIPVTNPVFRMAVANGLLPDLFDADGNVRTEANLLCLETQGGVALLATAPGELFPKLGLALKEQMRGEAGVDMGVVVGLANDELGYILPAEDFVFPADMFDPGDHYEETMSIGPDAGPLLMAQFGEMLRGRRDAGTAP